MLTHKIYAYAFYSRRISIMPPSRLTYIDPTFRCKLQCGQCTHIKPDGARCRNRVCFGTPVCWIHSIKKYGLRVKPSTVPDAGKGLFATKEFQEDDWIVPYVGELITENCLVRRYQERTAAYATANGRRTAVDSACQRGIASMANGIFNANGAVGPLRDHNVVIQNKVFGEAPHGLWLRATEGIPIGRELFVYYGDGFTLSDDNVTRRTTRADTRPC
jgi:hypothetical protein